MSEDEFVNCVRKCQEECELESGGPCTLPCDVCDVSKTPIDRDVLYWLERLEDAIDELESTYEDEDWDRIPDLVDELNRIRNKLEEEIMMHGCF